MGGPKGRRAVGLGLQEAGDKGKREKQVVDGSGGGMPIPSNFHLSYHLDIQLDSFYHLMTLRTLKISILQRLNFVLKKESTLQLNKKKKNEDASRGCE